jgi:hypothetical protein
MRGTSLVANHAAQARAIWAGAAQGELTRRVETLEEFQRRSSRYLLTFGKLRKSPRFVVNGGLKAEGPLGPPRADRRLFLLAGEGFAGSASFSGLAASKVSSLTAKP